MGMNMDWTLNATNMNEQRAQILADRLELDTACEPYDLRDGNFWYAWSTDSIGADERISDVLADLCKQWPDVRFERYGKADTDECFYKTEFENGKMREYTPKITYELYDEVTL